MLPSPGLLELDFPEFPRFLLGVLLVEQVWVGWAEKGGRGRVDQNQKGLLRFLPRANQSVPKIVGQQGPGGL